MSDRQVVLFLGAGASKLCGLPTVEEFFAQVQVPPGRGFMAAYEELARRIAIEEGTAQDMNWPKCDAEKLFGLLEQWVNTSGIAAGHPTVKLPQGNTEIPAGDLLTHLKSEIVRIYGHPPASGSSKRHYEGLFSLLLDKKASSNPIWVITTNYDSVLEGLLRNDSFLRRTSSNAGVLELRTGFGGGTPARWWPEMFSLPPRTGFCPVNVIKLHGSATWKWWDEGGVREPVDTGWGEPSGDYDCLVYFGYKSIPENDPFKTLHERLKDILLLKDAVVVSIGFRFADPYIRETFDFALRADHGLQVVCSLTLQPPPGSPLFELMKRFTDQVSLLVGEDGTPLPFGHGDFCKELGKRLGSIHWSRRAEPTLIKAFAACSHGTAFVPWAFYSLHEPTA